MTNPETELNEQEPILTTNVEEAQQPQAVENVIEPQAEAQLIEVAPDAVAVPEIEPEAIQTIEAATETVTETPAHEPEVVAAEAAVLEVVEPEVVAAEAPVLEVAEPEVVAAEAPVLEVVEPDVVVAEAPVLEVVEPDVVVAEEPVETVISEIHNIEELETVAEPVSVADYENYTKADFVKLLEAQLAVVNNATAKPSDFKRVDEVLKAIKPPFDQMKRAEKEIARQKFLAENEGNEEGFEYKNDADVQAFDSLYKQIRESKNNFFQNLEKSKDKNFSVKTELLQQLRELVDREEKDAQSQESIWQQFKKIQDEWKAAGNMVSPHNSTLWDTYNALIDRFYSNRNIYFELKDLDRKKNLVLKTELVEKVEELSKTVESGTLTKAIADKTNQIFEEYKHIGPAPKAEQEVLWQRLKMAMDVIYDARRAQNEDQKVILTQNYEVKSKIYEDLVPYTAFTSNSINEWNDKSREVMALQEQWNAIKAPMLREEGQELTKKFWATLKTFFSNKTEFFKQLEQKRAQHLIQKTQLCEQAEAIVASGEDTSVNTDRIIELQKEWKQTGQTADKFKNAIYERFKKACDAYFDQKRNKNKEADSEFVENLTKKQDLCARVTAASQAGETSLAALNAFKAEWNSVGFVPRKDMQTIQKQFVDAINGYVAAIGGDASLADVRSHSSSRGSSYGGGSGQQSNRRGNGNSGSGGGADRKDSEVRRKISQVENDLSVWQNNIEFFGRSKNSEKIRADFEKKIEIAQKQLTELKKQL
jgi:Domain of Unknown Function (DUF349)